MALVELRSENRATINEKKLFEADPLLGHTSKWSLLNFYQARPLTYRILKRLLKHMDPYVFLRRTFGRFFKKYYLWSLYILVFVFIYAI